jgi:hypothetical protein
MVEAVGSGAEAKEEVLTIAKEAGDHLTMAMIIITINMKVLMMVILHHYIIKISTTPVEK